MLIVSVPTGSRYWRVRLIAPSRKNRKAAPTPPATATTIGMSTFMSALLWAGAHAR